MKKTAFVFPGQGSQSVGMLKDLSMAYPRVNQLFSQASEQLGYDVWKMVQEGPEAQLNQTEHTQVAMLVADVAVYEAFQIEFEMTPVMMAGHSLGEYAALVCASALSLTEAVSLVQARGRLMQKTIPLGIGAMGAIIGLTDQTVGEICDEVSTDEHFATPANYNAVGLVVIAGHTKAVEKALALALTKGAMLAKVIPVSVPCHCGLLKEAADQFAGYLQKTSFKTPTIPVMSNVDLSMYQSPLEIKTLLEKQFVSPVRWVETIQSMKQQGVECVIECGPGKVLSGLIKRIEKSMSALSVNDPLSLTHAIQFIQESNHA